MPSKPSKDSDVCDVCGEISCTGKGYPMDAHLDTHLEKDRKRRHWLVVGKEDPKKLNISKSVYEALASLGFVMRVED